MGTKCVGFSRRGGRITLSAAADFLDNLLGVFVFISLRYA